MKSYVVATSTNYLSLAISILTQALLLPFLLHSIGAEATGLYTVFTTIANFAAVGIGWLSGAGVTMLASTPAERGSSQTQDVHYVVSLGFTAYATLFLVCTWVGAATVGTLWLRGARPEMLAESRRACMYLGAYFWLNYVHQADLSLFTALLEQGWANFYRIVAQLVFAAVTLAVVRVSPRLDLMMAANVCGVVVAMVAARVHLRRTGMLAPFRLRRPHPAIVRDVFVRVGGGYFIFGLGQFALLYGDVLLIGAVLGPVTVTQYIVIWKVPEVIATLLGRLSETLTPFLTRRASMYGASGVRTFFLVSGRIQHLLGISCGLLYGAFGQRVVQLWVGKSNTPSSAWLYWVAGAVLALQVVNRHDVILHFALARVSALIPVLFVELGLKWILVYLLFGRVGVGAPLAAQLAIQLGGLTWWYRRSGLRVVEARWTEWREQIGYPALVALAALVPAAYLGQSLLNGTQPPLVRWGGLAALLAGGALVFLRTLRLSDARSVANEFFVGA